MKPRRGVFRRRFRWRPGHGHEGDGGRSAGLASGRREEVEGNPPSLCDALQAASPGKRTFPINRAALAGAFVSLSPADAPDISQTSADAVFQGSRLAPVVEILDVARRSAQLVKQNFALAFLYNAVTIPLAVAGLVTPLLAAVAMSLSSLAVMVNSLRLAARRSPAGVC